VSAVHFAVTLFIALGLLLFAAGYREAPQATPGSASAARLKGRALAAVIVAGLIWGLFNIGIAMIFSFGPTMLVERGWTITAAGSAISIVLWLAALGGVAGGFLSDWTGRPQAVLVGGCVAFALLQLALPRSDAVIALVVAIGMIAALPSGPIMSLPAQVLQPQTRAIGMGIFYTVYYGTLMLGPAVAGVLAKSTGSAGVAFDFGAAMLLACVPLLTVFNRIAATPRVHQVAASTDSGQR
jgi:predicted MFS family arabinose efflux permease